MYQTCYFRFLGIYLLHYLGEFRAESLSSIVVKNLFQGNVLQRNQGRFQHVKSCLVRKCENRCCLQTRRNNNSYEMKKGHGKIDYKQGERKLGNGSINWLILDFLKENAEINSINRQTKKYSLEMMKRRWENITLREQHRIASEWCHRFFSKESPPSFLSNATPR